MSIRGCSALASGSRMGFVVRLLQPLNRDMRIDLGRRKASMTQQHLHATKIGTVLQEMSGKAVPEACAESRATGSTSSSDVSSTSFIGSSSNPFSEFADKKWAAMNARLRPVFLNRF